MNPEIIFYIILGIVCLEYILEETLDYLNLNHASTNIPEKLQGIYDDEEYAKSQNYFKEKSKFGFLSSFIGFTFNLILILGGFAWLNTELQNYPLLKEDPKFLALAFFGTWSLISGIIGLPFSYYNTFVIEEKYGFNKTTIDTFVGDIFKNILMSIILGGGFLYLFFWLLEVLDQNFWIYLWAIACAFILAVQMGLQELFIKLFNKLTPLEEGELRTAIEEYAKKVDFPLDNVFIMDGSKRSTKANAFFGGLGKRKKIVLFDTLVETLNTEEIVAVLAHEAGHYKRRHIVWMTISSFVNIGLILFLFSLIVYTEEISLALGLEKLYHHINLIAFFILLTPIQKVSSLLMTIFSRKNEFEADEYATETYSSHPLISALKKLSKKSLSNLTPHPSYVFYHYTHPTVLERIIAMEQVEARIKK